MDNKHFSQKITVFHGMKAPEVGTLVGYAAIIDSLQLQVPLPDRLSLISEKHKKYSVEGWNVYTIKHKPNDILYDQLVFALKYEGINLLFFKKLFEKFSTSEIEKWISKEPHSVYSRKIWFLYEWLMKKKMKKADLKSGNYVTLVDDSVQYVSLFSYNSIRHRIRNNLPGTVEFCPMIFKTEKLESSIKANLNEKTNYLLKKIHKDVLERTSAFLLLKDSKSSFTIENETPSQSRVMRWGRAIGQAGINPLNVDELLRLQQMVIESRFTKLGFRTEGGFVGEHDRKTGEPIPSHISARWQDLETLIQNLLITAKKLETEKFHPVLTSALIAFGFVFIHPFEDGNGRLHRYLIHHILSAMNFTPRGFIFPVSAAILEQLDVYRKILEKFSIPLLDFIEWKKTKNNNIEVLNETIDYYRYFDATVFAEFLFDCIKLTIEQVIPEEVDYLKKYDAMKAWLDEHFEMPDKKVDLLIRFLYNNNGRLSKRAKEKEFSSFEENEVDEIENKFSNIMNDFEM